MKICNIAGYKFINLDLSSLEGLRNRLKQMLLSLDLKGTILLSIEGINLFIAGEQDAIQTFVTELHNYHYFNDLRFKYSYSETLPFRKAVVRIKNEIIVCDDPSIKPHEDRAASISPQTFKQWYQEKKDMIVLDTRNQFEFDLGHFTNAKHLSINNFRNFSQAIHQLSEKDKDKPIVTYCTGGIRCEKAAIMLSRAGFNEVYQLEGGILNFFEQCGGEFYDGQCFVFDDRIAVNSQLRAINE